WRTAFERAAALARMRDRDPRRGIAPGLLAAESSPNEPGFRAYALQLLGDIATYPDRFQPESGELHYRQALPLASSRAMRRLVAHCDLGHGKLYRRADRCGHARELLRAATTMYREMDMCFWLSAAETEMHAIG